MHPATKSIASAIADFREEVSIDFTNAGDATRQEFKQEADINWILTRFAVSGVTPPQRTPVYGDRDFDIDLHTGYIAMGDAQRAFNRLPPLLREEYKSYLGLLDAVHNGTFKDALLEADTERGAPPPAPPIVPPA